MLAHIGENGTDSKHRDIGTGKTGHGDEGIIFNNSGIKFFGREEIKFDGILAEILELTGDLLTNHLVNLGLKF